ncbi:hypothetical protein ACET3Z_016905 [Daucus carota]
MNMAAQNAVGAMDSPMLTSLSLALALVLLYFTPLVQPLPVPALLLPPAPCPSRDDTPPITRPPPKNKKHIVPLPQPRVNADQDHQIPPPSRDEHNMGKKIGLLFMGIAAVLQVCVAAFLVLKSRKLFKNQNND